MILHRIDIKAGKVGESMFYFASTTSNIPDWGSAGTAVTEHAGSLVEMLPKFGVIAVAVAIVIAALMIYNKLKK